KARSGVPAESRQNPTSPHRTVTMSVPMPAKPIETELPSQRLPRVVVLLGWVSFLADVSGEMIYPLIPMFVVGVLGASAATLGGIEGAAQCVIALVTAWAGWRSDRR